jgi:hypothetical protein
MNDSIEAHTPTPHAHAARRRCMLTNVHHDDGREARASRHAGAATTSRDPPAREESGGSAPLMRSLNTDASRERDVVAIGVNVSSSRRHWVCTAGGEAPLRFGVARAGDDLIAGGARVARK